MQVGDTLTRAAALAAAFVCLGCADSPEPPPHIAPLDCPAAAASAYNGFGLDLLKALADESPEANTTLSPVGVTTVLSTIAPALHPEAQAALWRTLRTEALSVPDLGAALQALASWRSYSKGEVLFQSVTAVWLAAGTTLPPGVADRCRFVFGAHVKTLPADHEAAITHVNDWVREATHGRIRRATPELVSKEPLVVTNAAHFDGAWKHPFDRSDTEKATFHLVGSRTKTVPMMRRTSDLRYFAGSRFEAVALPYADPRFEFVLCLPAAASTLSAFVAGLDASSWDALLAGLHPCKVELGLPRFVLDSSADLEGPLVDLGAAPLFSKDLRGYRLAALHHAVRVRVFEEGTEADAATFAGLQSAAPAWLVVDRPFFFAIRETGSGLLLFTGLVFDPS